MRNLEEGNANDSSSSLSRLPDEIILLILNKLIDLKTLCICYLVSRRFSSIVLQVDAISFACPFSNPKPIPDSSTFGVGDVDGDGILKKLFQLLINVLRRMIVAPSSPLPPVESYISALSFLTKFRGLKSLCIELPSICHSDTNRRCLFKWKVNFGSTIKSFYFLSPNSISETDEFHVNGNGDEEEMGLTTDLFRQKVDIAFQSLKDMISRHEMLLCFVMNLPMLQEFSITDLERRGRLSVSGGKLAKVKKELVLSSAASETVDSEMSPVSVSQCYIPVLDLPVSGYVMKGVTFVVMEMNGVLGGNSGLINSENGFEDKEEAEAVMEILENYKDKMERFL